jgi:murein DD-endopeptidase MepM/ murein hydrolase activator NlpD
MAGRHGHGGVALAALALLAFAAGAAAKEHCSGGVCLTTRESAAGVAFAVANPLPVPIRVRVSFSDLENAEPSSSEPEDARVAPSERREVAALRRSDPARPYRYRFRWHFWLGERGARHDPDARYRMPFGGPAARRLSQGPNGAFSHRGEHAFDFLMPIGTPVLAAREGVVAFVVDRFERGGARKSLKDQANEVIVAHADGTLARYVHLSRGAAVAVGDQVAAGALLGKSGNTGYSTEPHLHFEVYTAGAGPERDTLPIRFASEDAAGFVPVEGSAYPPQEPPQ